MVLRVTLGRRAVRTNATSRERRRHLRERELRGGRDRGHASTHVRPGASAVSRADTSAYASTNARTDCLTEAKTDASPHSTP
mmetsp:Transcript_8983/g.37112  ORF Transcript_8983/g.37112 Transcript_8983/m.37112 type:complete len:82 (-) Transcript_8983:1408-1653(-)